MHITHSFWALCLVLHHARAQMEYLNATARAYAILGAQSVTDAGGLLDILGDVGVYPGTSLSASFLASAHVQSGQAQANVLIAFDALSALEPSPGFAGFGTAALTNVIYTAGVYNFASSVEISGLVTLIGADTDVFVFQIGSSLLVDPSAVIKLVGVSACNVYFVVGSSATIFGGPIFYGEVLAYASITLEANAYVMGGLYALTASVSLSGTNHTVFSQSCGTVTASSPPTTVVTAPNHSGTAAGIGPLLNTPTIYGITRHSTGTDIGFSPSSTSMTGAAVVPTGSASSTRITGADTGTTGDLDTTGNSDTTGSAGTMSGGSSGDSSAGGVAGVSSGGSQALSNTDGPSYNTAITTESGREKIFYINGKAYALVNNQLILISNGTMLNMTSAGLYISRLDIWQTNTVYDAGCACEKTLVVTVPCTSIYTTTTNSADAILNNAVATAGSIASASLISQVSADTTTAVADGEYTGAGARLKNIGLEYVLALTAGISLCRLFDI